MGSDFSFPAMFALTAAAMAFGISALYVLVWRVLRHPWTGMLALGFAFGFAGHLVNYHLAALPFDQAARYIAPLVGCAYLCFTLAIMDYTGFAPARRRFWCGITLAYLAGVSALVQGLWVGFGTLMALQAVLPVSWALLFLRAMRREPGHGHEFNVLALLAFPVIAYAIHRGWFPPDYRRNMGMLSHSLMGVTLLTTGLLKAHRTAQAELAARVKVSQELDAVNHTLETRIRERTEALEHTVRSLESFNRHVAHDLRGPLGGIAGVANLAAEHLQAGRHEAASRLLHAITHQAEVSKQLVGALLDWARSDHQPLRREPVAMNELVADVIEGLQAAQLGANSAAKPLVIEGAASLPTAVADATLLRQVWANLLTNAVKFSQGTAEPRVMVGFEHLNGRGVYWVQDNGVGFSPEQGAALFSLFARPHGASFEGFGIGLCLVKRIVERHGGQVWAHSEPGQGARFSFTLEPAQQADAAVAPA
jgi:signal transduction histidine kinase